MGLLNRWNIAIPELPQTAEKPFDIFRIAPVEKVDIPSEPGIAVKNYRFSTDDQIPNAMPLQKPQELQDVRRKPLAAYLLFFRHASLTSGGLAPKTRRCRRRAALIRSSQDMA
jgi:hypothetical protein